MFKKKSNATHPVFERVGLLFKSHPWHGVPIGEEAPEQVTAYIEAVPTDTVKYEVDKTSGYLKIDRPHQFSSVCPTLYGFIPQTYCNSHVAKRCVAATGRKNIVGDSDPIDICVIAEKAIVSGDILLQAIPIGGFRLIDGDEADDKIISVMKDDAVYGDIKDISELPDKLIERLKHYFLTYKDQPGSEHRKCELPEVYGREEAFEVIRASQADYVQCFPKLGKALAQYRKAVQT